MKTFQLIVLIALAVVVAVKCQAECTYGENIFLEGEIIYTDRCSYSYCVCNGDGELSDCDTVPENCNGSCPDGYLPQQEDQCCPLCVPDSGN